MSNKVLQPVRGTQDIFQDDLTLHHFVVDIARQKSLIYGYQEIITPIFEYSTLFHRTLGDTSDVLAKETYTFLDRDKTSITLRPELTAASVRALLSNGWMQSLPLKLFSSGAVFRHERPQKCRYRQFHQVNYEFFGSASPAADVEIITLGLDILRALGLEGKVMLEINTIGDVHSRARYQEALINYLNHYKDDLSPASLVRLAKNPLRILDSKDEKDQEIVSEAPQITSFLSAQAVAHYGGICEYLTKFGIAYRQNSKLVRGLDYYTDTVFEFTTASLGSQGTVLAGGRYNNLTEAMGGPQIPAVGFAAGVERLAALLKQQALQTPPHNYFCLVPIGPKAEAYAVELLHELRTHQIAVALEYDINLKKRMQRANKMGAVASIIFGDEELAAKTCIVKDMQEAVEKIIPLSDMASYLAQYKK